MAVPGDTADCRSKKHRKCKWRCQRGTRRSAAALLVMAGKLKGSGGLNRHRIRFGASDMLLEYVMQYGEDTGAERIREELKSLTESI